VDSGHRPAGESAESRSEPAYSRRAQNSSDRKPADGDPHPFVIDAVDNEDSQCQRLAKILKECRDQGVAILVLPELRVTPTLEGVVRGWLGAQTNTDGLLLVVAGSWHVMDGGRYVNRSIAFDHRGHELWRNDKLAEYNVSPGNVAKNPSYWVDRGVGPSGAVEDIRAGRVLAVADTPLGRLTSAICAGFFQGRAADVMRQSGANFFFVPAMTNKMDDLERLAADLVRYRAGSFIANCGHFGAKAPCYWQAGSGESGRARRRQRILIWTLGDT